MVKENGGDPLFDYYPSLYAVLKTHYPDYPWDGTKFQAVPAGYWKDKENLMKALELAETKMGITKVTPSMNK